MSDAKTKTQKPQENPPAETEKGAFLCARDLQRIRATKRHADSESAVTEARRLAENMSERILILKVVGVVNRRKKKKKSEDGAE